MKVTNIISQMFCGFQPLYSTFEAVHSLTVNGTINKMKVGPQGVWISLRSSNKICLYDTTIYMRLLEFDYTNVSPTAIPNNYGVS